MYPKLEQRHSPSFYHVEVGSFKVSLAPRHGPLSNISIEELKFRAKLLAVCDRLANRNGRYFSYIERWRISYSRSLFDSSEGDIACIYFSPKGSIVRGFAHESDMSPLAEFSPFRDLIEQNGGVWPGMYDQLPESLEKMLTDSECEEPTTFCYWRQTKDVGWYSGVKRVPEGDDPDGARDVLKPFILADDALIWWAQRLYDLKPKATENLRDLMVGTPINDDVIEAFRCPLSTDLISDLNRIGWPQSLGQSR